MIARCWIIFTILFIPESLISQTKQEAESAVKGKYLSINVFSLAEPHMAFGPSAGIRFTDRSEFFTEAAFVTRSPIRYSFNSNIQQLRGARFIIQYRYHFLQRWRPLIKLNSASKHHRSLYHPFMAAEFRFKPLSFNTQATFINYSTNDTLENYSFNANTITLGGALIFGHTINLSIDGRWKFEITAGVGAKKRIIRNTTVPSGYKLPYVERIAFQVPRLYEELGTVQLPVAFRLRYLLD